MIIIFSIIVAGFLALMAVYAGSGSERDVTYGEVTSKVTVPATAGDHALRIVFAILALTSLTLPALHGGWLLILIVVIAGVAMLIYARGAEDVYARLDQAEEAWRAEMWEAEKAEMEAQAEALHAEARAHAEAMRQEQKADPQYRRAEAEARLRGLIAGGDTAEDAL